MKKNMIIAICILITFVAGYSCIYKPYVSKKEVKNAAQNLQVGSYIFSTSMGYNGNQSLQSHYFVFKVTQIVDDYVRLAVVRKFYGSQKMFDVRLSALDGYFSASKAIYEDAKKTIANDVVTAVKTKYIRDYNELILTDSLRLKYPGLLKSRLFVEDVSNLIKPTKESPIYGDKMFFFSLVYSKKEIMNNAKLVPYYYNYSNDNKISLEYGSSENIDKIINLK